MSAVSDHVVFIYVTGLISRLHDTPNNVYIRFNSIFTERNDQKTMDLPETKTNKKGKEFHKNVIM